MYPLVSDAGFQVTSRTEVDTIATDNPVGGDEGTIYIVD